MASENTIPVDDAELRSRVERLARTNGTSEADIVREALEEYLAAHEGDTCYDRAERVGLIGCVEDAPPDLSTNPDHFEGFGRG